MVRVILEKTEKFDETWDSVKEGLESFFGREFEDFEKLRDEIYSKGLPRVYFPKEEKFKVPTIPFTIKKCSLYGPDHATAPYDGEFPIAIAKIVD